MFVIVASINSISVIIFQFEKSLEVSFIHLISVIYNVSSESSSLKYYLDESGNVFVVPICMSNEITSKSLGNGGFS